MKVSEFYQQHLCGLCCLLHVTLEHGLAGTSASEVTTLWRYTNLFSIIIITRKVIPIWIFLKQETVASAALYVSLHLAPGRQPHQHPTTQFFYRPDALPAAQPTASKH